jgi:hypothetical protein
MALDTLSVAQQGGNRKPETCSELRLVGSVHIDADISDDSLVFAGTDVTSRFESVIGSKTTQGRWVHDEVDIVALLTAHS